MAITETLQEPGTGRTVLVVLIDGESRVALLAEGELPEKSYDRIAERAFRAQAKLRMSREAFGRNLKERARMLYDEAAASVKEIERNVSLHQRKQLVSTVESVGVMLQVAA